MVWTTTLSSKGQMVLPKAVREALGAEPGSKIVLADRQGRIELRAYSGNILKWYGALKVEEPQDWESVKRESRLARAREVARGPQGD